MKRTGNTKIKPIRQRDSSACGPTSIKMVANYFHVPISWDRIGKVSDYRRRDGLHNRDLVRTLEKLGFRVRSSINTTWSRLKRNNVTGKVIVVSWMLKGYIGHFSIVDRITDKAVYLADPESGKIIRIDRIIFMRLWLDYDPKWYPVRNTDINLRWMAVISKR
ncbi:C39 family peptidase [Candidatus Uhrbacteria bacterium]|nr:C39 family peptidase [Candidatus Uhrbacteria bacterium]